MTRNKEKPQPASQPERRIGPEPPRKGKNTTAKQKRTAAQQQLTREPSSMTTPTRHRQLRHPTTQPPETKGINNIKEREQKYMGRRTEAHGNPPNPNPNQPICHHHPVHLQPLKPRALPPSLKTAYQPSLIRQQTDVHPEKIGIQPTFRQVTYQVHFYRTLLNSLSKITYSKLGQQATHRTATTSCSKVKLSSSPPLSLSLPLPPTHARTPFTSQTASGAGQPYSTKRLPAHARTQLGTPASVSHIFLPTGSNNTVLPSPSFKSSPNPKQSNRRTKNTHTKKNPSIEKCQPSLNPFVLAHHAPPHACVVCVVRVPIGNAQQYSEL